MENNQTRTKPNNYLVLAIILLPDSRDSEYCECR